MISPSYKTENIQNCYAFYRHLHTKIDTIKHIMFYFKLFVLMIPQNVENINITHIHTPATFHRKHPFILPF